MRAHRCRLGDAVRAEMFSLKYAVCGMSDHTHSLISPSRPSRVYPSVSMVESSHSAHRGGDVVRELKILRARVGSWGQTGPRMSDERMLNRLCPISRLLLDACEETGRDVVAERFVVRADEAASAYCAGAAQSGRSAAT